MKKSVLCLTVAALLAPCVMAQEIVPVWEHYNTPSSPNPFFPFMVAQSGAPGAANSGGEVPGYENTFFEMDIISSLVRYDDDRLLMFIVENGINEQDPAQDQALAAQYPDRTIWWINDGDGSPLGMALDVRDPARAQKIMREGTEYTVYNLGGVPTSDFFIERALDDRSRRLRPDLKQETAPKCEVDAEGNIYVTDRHKLLRYTPNGQGGFDGPTVAYEYPQVNPPQRPDGTPMSDGHYRSWRMADVNIVGEGPNKIMVTSGRVWIDGTGLNYYTSDDGGASWTRRVYIGQNSGNVGTGGGVGRPVINTAFDEEYLLAVSFPGSGDRTYRMVRGTQDPDEEFTQDSAEFWVPERDPAVDNEAEPGLATHLYQGWTKVDTDAYQDIPYFVTATIPKWKNLGDDWQGNPYPSAWIAINSYAADPNNDGLEGDFVTAYPLPWTDQDEPNIPDPNFDEGTGAAWHNTYQVEIKMYVGDDFADGAFEILYSGGGIGYGRYTVGDTNINSWSVY